MIVRLLLPDGRPPSSIEALSEALHVPIWTEPDLGQNAVPVYGDEHCAILVHEEVPEPEQVRAALHALKCLIDVPARPTLGRDAFSAAQYSNLVHRFVDMVLERHGP
jgi:hypothetical protein